MKKESLYHLDTINGDSDSFLMWNENNTQKDSEL